MIFNRLGIYFFNLSEFEYCKSCTLNNKNTHFC